MTADTSCVVCECVTRRAAESFQRLAALTMQCTLNNVLHALVTQAKLQQPTLHNQARCDLSTLEATPICLPRLWQE